MSKITKALALSLSIPSILVSVRRGALDVAFDVADAAGGAASTIFISLLSPTLPLTQLFRRHTHTSQHPHAPSLSHLTHTGTLECVGPVAARRSGKLFWFWFLFAVRW